MDKYASKGVCSGHGYHGKVTFEKLDRFQRALYGLCYEGKSSRGKNLRYIQDTIKFFDEDLIEHMQTEERSLFPFLAVHIPKLQPLLTMLLSEHEDFRKNLSEIKRLVLRLKNRQDWDSATLDRIKDQGTYLVMLLRSHVWAEERMIERTARKQLHSDEMKKLDEVMA